MGNLCIYHAIVPEEFDFRHSQICNANGIFNLTFEQKPLLAKSNANKDMKKLQLQKLLNSFTCILA
jgi:hypothetical protein